MKHLFTFFFTLFVVNSMVAQVYDFVVDGISYKILSATSVEVASREYYLSHLEGIDCRDYYSGAVIIPSSVTYSGRKYSVTEIGAAAFYCCCEITSITIPNSVTNINYNDSGIGYKAFYGCTGLTSVTLPESLDVSNELIYFTKDGIRYHVLNGKEVEVVDAYASSIEIPQIITAGNNFSVVNFSRNFDTENRVEEIVVDENNPYFCSINGVLYNKDATQIIYCPKNKKGAINIPTSVTSIDSDLFYHRTGLTSVTIPESVTSIGDCAFEGCTGLTSITIPESVTSIGDRAFEGCTGLVSVSFPNSLDVAQSGLSFTQDGIRYRIYNDKEVSIQRYPTSYTGDLVIPQTVSAGNIYTITGIGELAFRECTSLTSITIPESVTSIGDYAFHLCTSLTSVTIPESVTSIGETAFYACTSLTSITIPESVTSIGEGAFLACIGLTSITIPESVTSIGYRAFEGCRSLTSITIPESVTSIGDYAFMECTSLTSITIPESVTSIGDYAFQLCTSLTSVTIPESVTSIGSCAFAECSNLEEIIVEEGNQYYCSIDGVLYNRDTTELISFPERNKTTQLFVPKRTGISSCNDFSYCSNLEEIIVEEGNQNYCSIDGVLYNRDTTRLLSCPGGKIGHVSIPETVTHIEDGAFDACANLTSITISKNVKKIPTLAKKRLFNEFNSGFDGCSSLEEFQVDEENRRYYSVNGVLYASTIPRRLIAYPEGKKKLPNKIGDIAEERTLTETNVVVEPQIYAADFSFPEEANVDTYELTIKKGNKILYNLTFDADAVLQKIDLSELKSEPQGFRFIVTGLSSATSYSYLLRAKSAEDRTLQEYSGTFVTQNEDGTGGSFTPDVTTEINNIENELIVTISNRQIFVNGEAPAFVLTSLGQKIVNKNLQAGIYFVQVGNEMQGVAVKSR